MDVTLRVQVPNNHIIVQNLYSSHCYPRPGYLSLGYLDPLGKGCRRIFRDGIWGEGFRVLKGLVSIGSRVRLCKPWIAGRENGKYYFVRV